MRCPQSWEGGRPCLPCGSKRHRPGGHGGPPSHFILLWFEHDFDCVVEAAGEKVVSAYTVFERQGVGDDGRKRQALLLHQREELCHVLSGVTPSDFESEIFCVGELNGKGVRRLRVIAGDADDAPGRMSCNARSSADGLPTASRTASAPRPFGELADDLRDFLSVRFGGNSAEFASLFEPVVDRVDRDHGGGRKTAMPPSRTAIRPVRTRSPPQTSPFWIAAFSAQEYAVEKMSPRNSRLFVLQGRRHFHQRGRRHGDPDKLCLSAMQPESSLRDETEPG